MPLPKIPRQLSKSKVSFRHNFSQLRAVALIGAVWRGLFAAYQPYPSSMERVFGAVCIAIAIACGYVLRGKCLRSVACLHGYGGDSIVGCVVCWNKRIVGGEEGFWHCISCLDGGVWMVGTRFWCVGCQNFSCLLASSNIWLGDLHICNTHGWNICMDGGRMSVATPAGGINVIYVFCVAWLWSLFYS